MDWLICGIANQDLVLVFFNPAFGRKYKRRTCDVYMERHYRSVCSYLQECLNATREELKKLRPKLGSGEEKSAQSHQKRTLKC